MGITITIGSGLMYSCTSGNRNETVLPYKKRDLNLPPFLEKASEGVELKAGLIGCGGRGTGAAINFIEAGSNLTIWTLGDVFQDRVDNCRGKNKT